MLAVGLRFPGGRYHATPWGRHVNEGEIEWPPSPWRLSRTLIALWYRKMAPEERDRPVLEKLLTALAAERPVYRLPPASGAHARHFMPIRKGKGETRTLVFDAFARVDPDSELVVAWPTLELEAEERRLLNTLADRLGYLGRAESWAVATVLDDWDGTPNCFPVDDAATASEAAGSGGWDPVESLVPRSPEDYRAFRSHLLEGLAARGARKADQRKVARSLPEDWLDALSVETADLEAAGWNRPPAAQVVGYSRAAGCLEAPAPAIRGSRGSRERPTTARFALFGRPLPRIEDAVKIGEVLRKAMVCHGDEAAGSDPPPEVLTGHFEAGDSDHRHAFYLPEDGDGDGLIDHLVVHASAGLGPVEQRALDTVRKIWLSDGSGEWRVLLEGIGTPDTVGGASRLFAADGATTWISETPYLHPWHVKKKLTVEDQLRKECGLRDDLPELLALEHVEDLRVGGRSRRPVHYHRFRSKRGLSQPDRHGSFWRLTFSEPLHGPLALGFGCHFGLGLFRPEGDEPQPT